MEVLDLIDLIGLLAATHVGHHPMWLLLEGLAHRLLI